MMPEISQRLMSNEVLVLVCYEADDTALEQS